MSKLLWIDMEMTGLDHEREVPIEIAAIVTDINFKELDEYHAVIRQPQSYLDAMDDWNKQHHGSSGLASAVPNGLDPQAVEQDMLKLIARYFETPAVIAGNSIGQDRLFINKHFRNLAAKLHYRMLDVTAWKVVMNERYQVRYEKKNSHRALDDIRESIAELNHYLKHVSPQPL